MPALSAITPPAALAGACATAMPDTAAAAKRPAAMMRLIVFISSPVDDCRTTLLSGYAPLTHLASGYSDATGRGSARRDAAHPAPQRASGQLRRRHACHDDRNPA